MSRKLPACKRSADDDNVASAFLASDDVDMPPTISVGTHIPGHLPAPEQLDREQQIPLASSVPVSLVVNQKCQSGEQDLQPMLASLQAAMTLRLSLFSSVCEQLEDQDRAFTQRAAHFQLEYERLSREKTELLEGCAREKEQMLARFANSQAESAQLVREKSEMVESWEKEKDLMLVRLAESQVECQLLAVGSECWTDRGKEIELLKEQHARLLAEEKAEGRKTSEELRIAYEQKVSEDRKELAKEKSAGEQKVSEDRQALAKEKGVLEDSWTRARADLSKEMESLKVQHERVLAEGRADGLQRALDWQAEVKKLAEEKVGLRESLEKEQQVVKRLAEELEKSLLS